MTTMNKFIKEKEKTFPVKEAFTGSILMSFYV